MKRGTRKQPGQSLVILAIFAITLVLFMGVAIDAGMLYTQRRHLQNYVDAACLAAATHIARGQSGDPAATAATYFNDNLDNNAALALTGAITPTYAVSGRDVRVTVAAQAQSYFMQVGGIDTYNVSARAHCDAAEGGGLWPVAINRFPSYKPAPQDDQRITNNNTVDPNLSLPQTYGNGGHTPEYVVVRDILQAASANNSTLNDGPLDGTTSGCSTRRNWYDWPSLGSPANRTGPFRPPCLAASLTDPGYVVDLLGSGANPSKGQNNSFSGPLLLDYRQVSFTPHLLYNGMTEAINVNAWKDRITQNILQGYPGPRVIPGQQIAIPDGVSANQTVGAVDTRYNVNDVVTALVYNGIQYKNPDFSVVVTCVQGQAPANSCNNTGSNGGDLVERAAYSPPVPETCRRDGRYFIAQADPAFTTAPQPAAFNVQILPLAGGGAAPVAQSLQLTARASDAAPNEDYDNSAASFGKVLVRWVWSGGATGWQRPDEAVDVDVPIGGINVQLFVVQSETEECTPAPTATNPTPTPVTIPKRVTGTQTIEVIGRSTSTSRQHGDFGSISMLNYTNDTYLSFVGDIGGGSLNVDLSLKDKNSTINVNNSTLANFSVSTPAGINSATVVKQGNSARLSINAAGAAAGEYPIDVSYTAYGKTQTVRYFLRIEPDSNPSINTWVIALCYANFKISYLDSNTVKGNAVSGCLTPEELSGGLRARLLPWD